MIDELGHAAPFADQCPVGDPVALTVLILAVFRGGALCGHRMVFR